jgi:hypothetical protein
MSAFTKSVLAAAIIACVLPLGEGVALDLTPQQLADSRARVAAAATLAAIGRVEKDGDMLLVAAKLIAKSGGAVAIPGMPLTNGKPTTYSLKGLLEESKALGVDAGKADQEAIFMTPVVNASCFWHYSCDSYQTSCQWMYIC